MLWICKAWLCNLIEVRAVGCVRCGAIIMTETVHCSLASYHYYITKFGHSFKTLQGFLKPLVIKGD